jgi:hypothetical protein
MALADAQVREMAVSLLADVAKKATTAEITFERAPDGAVVWLMDRREPLHGPSDEYPHALLFLAISEDGAELDELVARINLTER